MPALSASSDILLTVATPATPRAPSPRKYVITSGHGPLATAPYETDGVTAQENDVSTAILKKKKKPNQLM